MFETTAVSVRLKKECANFINSFFKNKQEFMRKAIEHYSSLAMIRLQEPQGGVAVNFYTGGYGMVQYYWNYYKGRQFIVVTNESGFDFQRQPTQFRDKIFEKLKITTDEEVDFYVQYKAETIQHENLGYSKTLWHHDKFACWSFESNSFTKGLISEEAITEMVETMNMHNSHYILNREAFVYEKLYSAQAEWEELPSLKCKTIKGL